jgi:hypothetical protein
MESKLKLNEKKEKISEFLANPGKKNDKATPSYQENEAIAEKRRKTYI